MQASQIQAPRGKYFDDFEIGEEFRTPKRTITSTDIVNFACLTGDFNEVHTNFEYCKDTAAGQPIAHGPLVYAVSAGLQYASGVNDGTLLALLQIDGWRMIAPVLHGDTIQMVTTILEKKASSKPDRGVVTLKRTILNQHGKTVQEMVAKLLYRRREQ
ncbi:MAG: MaoC/PaaZ C-terminal domain-containing protein [Polaromonas sp.]|nr:MaoC/PaaZ C-terminal domain-containing protein [Polaromonas sp.]